MKKTTIIASVTITCLIMTGALFLSATCVRGVTSDPRSTQREMGLLKTGLSLYVQEYGEMPDETSNTRILELLTRGNPRKLSFYNAPDHRIQNGQVLDAWDHPFIFQKTADNLVIRSAGKDGIYHSKDDLTLSAREH